MTTTPNRENITTVGIVERSPSGQDSMEPRCLSIATRAHPTEPVFGCTSERPESKLRTIRLEN